MKYYPIRILLLVMFCLCLFVINKNVIAQTIPNGDFEVWTISGLPVSWHTNNITWPFDCRQGLSSGIYFYKLFISALQSKDGRAGTFVETRKMILLR